MSIVQIISGFCGWEKGILQNFLEELIITLRDFKQWCIACIG